MTKPCPEPGPEILYECHTGTHKAQVGVMVGRVATPSDNDICLRFGDGFENWYNYRETTKVRLAVIHGYDETRDTCGLAWPVSSENELTHRLSFFNEIGNSFTLSVVYDGTPLEL